MYTQEKQQWAFIQFKITLHERACTLKWVDRRIAMGNSSPLFIWKYHIIPYRNLNAEKTLLIFVHHSYNNQKKNISAIQANLNSMGAQSYLGSLSHKSQSWLYFFPNDQSSRPIRNSSRLIIPLTTRTKISHYLKFFMNKNFIRHYVSCMTRENYGM